MDGKDKGIAGLIWDDHTTWMKDRKVRLVEGGHTQHGWKREGYGWLIGGLTHYIDERGRYGWFNGALRKNWMEKRKVRLVEWGQYTQNGWETRKVQLLEWGLYTRHGWKRKRHSWLNGGHIHMDGRQKGTAV